MMYVFAAILRVVTIVYFSYLIASYACLVFMYIGARSKKEKRDIVGKIKKTWLLPLTNIGRFIYEKITTFRG